MSNIHFAGNVAYMTGSKSAVYFSKSAAGAGEFSSQEIKGATGTAIPIQKIQDALEIAPWGEDNRFPQNIERQMSYCGVGKAALDWKAKMLYGNGLVPGIITGVDDNGEDIFTPLDRTKYKKVYDFIKTPAFFRFMIEYLGDWCWFTNCFPELILSNDCTEITGIVHQESCDARFKQMNEAGEFTSVYLSKLWGASEDQYAQFDPQRKMKGLAKNPTTITEEHRKYIAELPCIDMYNAHQSLISIAADLKKSGKDLKSAILPVNWPSPNKTYYQVPSWDGARLGGWIEIACKIPSLLKTLYNKAFSIKYHIEIPETYFERKYGPEIWLGFTEDEQLQKRTALLEMMEEFLTGDENAYKTFISFFDVDPHKLTEYGRIKITPLEDKTNIDKELITSSAADMQVLVAMNVNPALFGAGRIGTGQQRSGGSDIREAFLTYTASLHLERQVLLQPLYLVRDFNNWGSEIEFRFRDTILTTLDTGAGTKKIIS